LYTALELSSKVTAHRFPPLPEEPSLLSTASTLSKAEPWPNMLVAEILLPPLSSEFPTSYLYVSNRNDPSPEGDTIAIFSVEGGKLELVNEVRTGLNHLRAFAFEDSGRWLVAGGANGGGVKMYERVDGGRDLKEVASVAVDQPTSFLWM
jgi:6-phosphogluconolactonase (cycloisomerase 2 family)